MARKIKHLILHHSVSNWGDGKTIVAWHTNPKPRGNGWKTPGYHAVICNGYPSYNSWSARKFDESALARVDRIVSESIASNGVKYGNSDALHVCIIGDYDKTKLPNEIKNKVIDLFAFWCKKYDLDPMKAIRGHGERQAEIGKEDYRKTCPGKNVNMNEIRRAVAATL